MLNFQLWWKDDRKIVFPPQWEICKLIVYPPQWEIYMLMIKGQWIKTQRLRFSASTWEPPVLVLFAGMLYKGGLISLLIHGLNNCSYSHEEVVNSPSPLAMIVPILQLQFSIWIRKVKVLM